MDQNDRDLLLRDLSARLPYNLYVRVEEFNVPKNEAITEGFVGNYLKDNRCNDYDADGILNELADGCIDIKPYLRPMSSMTEEEFVEYHNIKYNKVTYRDNWERIEVGKYHNVGIIPIDEYLDWLNEHHFDYRGLIEKGLALESTEDMYKLK